MEFTCESFSGPLDLLLSLVIKNKVGIYNIPIAEITRQYIAYIENISEMDYDLETSSEFIVLAAELLRIKSRSLLPKPQLSAEEVDPEAELAQRLLEYSRFKEAATALAAEAITSGFPYFKESEQIAPLVIDDSMSGVTLHHLLEAYRQAISSLSDDTENEPEKNINRIIERPVYMWAIIRRLLRRFRNDTFLPLAKVFCDCVTRSEIIGTFLAILELIKLSRIIILSEDNNVVLRYSK